ncbi:MAG: ATP synthase F1 subunit epsilon [Defluviitaleaceae bacterium]|nr:ATP synthase F1 subunit epsilon [Defluviitaleaceae bacterium]
MATTKLQLRILTAESVKFDEPVDMVIMRCIVEDMGVRSAVGDIGILPGHMPLSAVLSISPLRIKNDDNVRIIAVHGGVVNVRDDVVTVMTDMAEWPEEIDLARAEAAKAKAEAEAQNFADDKEIRSNQISLRRALVQIEVSSYPLVGGRK